MDGDKIHFVNLRQAVLTVAIICQDPVEMFRDCQVLYA